MFSWLFATVVAVGSMHAAAAEPQVDDKTRNAARSLAEQGRDVYLQGEYERAYDLFHRAYGLVPAPSIALYEARALVKLGRLVQAQETYLRAVRTKLTNDSPEAFRKAVQEAEGEEAALEGRIPKVTLVLVGPGAKQPNVSVKADGELLEPELVGVDMPINPGSHVVTASAPGGEETRVSFTIAEGVKQRFELTIALPVAQAPHVKEAPPMRPAAAPPQRAAHGSWQAPVAYAAGALGIAGIASGVLTGSMAQSHYSEAKTKCPNHTCVEGSSGADELASFRTLRTISTAAYIVGAVGLAAGVTLLVLAPRHEHASSTAIFLGPGHAGVRGTF
ncbi:MAG TPA: hypothetical protein VHB79_31465 [Polyangiaceae bacterium]|nr:hypothetical protein [Polyangiaceae bacterium]